MERRTFLKMAAAVPLLPNAMFQAQGSARAALPPVGLAMFTLRVEEQADRMATLTAVAEMGYKGVEFTGRYFEWTLEQTKAVRKHLDGLGLTCYSTHTSRPHFAPEHLSKAADLNNILGSKHIVMAHSAEVNGGADGWKALAADLTRAHEWLRPRGISGGFHNWSVEWERQPTYRAIDILVANTPKDFGFQIDTGGAFRHKTDLVEFMQKYPGRVRSLHIKDWTPETNATGMILGDGVIKWLPIFEACEKVGGIQYYLIEQEGSRLSALETAKVSLVNYRKIRGI